MLDLSRAGQGEVEPNPYASVELFFAALAALGVAAGAALCLDPAVRLALNTAGGSLYRSPGSNRPSPPMERGPPTGSLARSGPLAGPLAGQGPKGPIVLKVSPSREWE